MTQGELFTKSPKAKPEKPLTCAGGFPWLDHFEPPIGTGKGCPYCDAPLSESETGRSSDAVE